MSRAQFVWTMSMAWLLAAAGLFVVVGGASLRDWLLLTVVGLIPPIMLFTLAKDAPALTIAETLHDTEGRR